MGMGRDQANPQQVVQCPFGVASLAEIVGRGQAVEEPIDCTLGENALDYLILAGEQVQEGSPRMVKHGLATLADGIELLLKARLELEDWRLVFDDQKKASPDAYESGDFSSVSYKNGIKRLRDYCSIELSNENAAVIAELRDLRNRIRHFAVNTEKTTSISLIVKTFSFAIEFVGDHLADLNESLESELFKLRELLGEFQEFVDQRITEIQDNLDAAYLVVRCPTCLQDALELGNGEAHCLFCEMRAEGEPVARQWVRRFFAFQSMKDSLVSPQIETCPECGEDACVDMSQETDGEITFVCFGCGESGDYKHCSECNSLHESDHPSDRCDDCWSDLMARND
jgi:hypothetical protein